MKKERVRLISSGKEIKGPVVYWMSRDQRFSDNWALIYAQEWALQKKSPLIVVFCLVSEFLGATIRQFGFMLKGLKEMYAYLQDKNISFHLLKGVPDSKIPRFIIESHASALITDFDPLKIKRNWKKNVTAKVDIPVYEVDAHNIIPCWYASSKQEWAAYSFRPKVKRMLNEFVDEFPKIKKHPYFLKGDDENIPWDEIEAKLKADRSIKEVDWIKAGESSAQKMLRKFVKTGLQVYDAKRNDPNQNGQSNLSPYLHYGQLSAQRVALEVIKSGVREDDKRAFLEELVVRRELADNFCFYNQDYDNFAGFPDWAKKTLDDHRKDIRNYNYSNQDFEQAETHDRLWNAAQIEMMRTGKMHGYMRMYWAKKILEWTKKPEEALSIAIYLNDKYELDGRDPNGYTGIAWSLGGVHDRPWFERTVFGKIRYMSKNGAQKKFDVDAYIDRYSL